MADLHDLTAAYALDALDERERSSYEEHLGSCERCRAELSTLAPTAAALAYLPSSPAPPAALRGRILAAATEGRENVVPLRRGPTYRWVAAAAAVAACAALVLGIWATSLHRSLGEERDARSADARALAVLADPDARHVPLSGREGTLVVARDGSAAILAPRLARAPEGRTYEAWVIRDGSARSAGLFDGGDATVVTLTRPVPRGATVGVTVEREGGVDAPTSAPIASARA
jgi:anti-sigma factor RsiW